MQSNSASERKFQPSRLTALAWRFALPEAIVFSLAAILYFYNAFRFSLPIGYGGLFGLMSEEIVADGFALPPSVPYYGPGGIPFAYPPLGLYLAAIVQRLAHASFLDYARWQPPLVSVMFVVAFYWLGRATLRSRGGALAASLIVATAGEVFGNQATASGVVRSVAGFWMVASCAMAVVAYGAVNHRKVLALSAGVLYGLLLATHLSYAVVGGLGILALGASRGRRSWWSNGFTGTGILAAGVLVAAPWWGTVLLRHGPEVFASALQTHGNAGIISHVSDGILQTLKLPGGWFLNMGSRWSPLPLVGLTIVGLGAGVVKGNWALVSWFTVVLLFTGEPDRYLAMIGALLAGDLIGDLVQTAGHESLGEAPTPRLRRWIAGALILSVVCWQGFNLVRSGEPALTQEALALGTWFRDRTPQSAEFLFVSGQHDLAEWMPFLLRRTPTTAPWGSEWIGRYGVESRRFERIGQCADAQSFDCVGSFLADEGMCPDYLIVPKDLGGLISQNESAPDWTKVFENDGYWVLGRPVVSPEQGGMR